MSKIENAKRESDGYVMTVNPSRKSDMAKLDAVRSAIKAGNATGDARLRVKLHGRLGKNSEFAPLYSGKPRATIKLEHAKTIDVYVFGGKSKRKSPMAKAASKAK